MAGLKSGVAADFYTSVTRPAAVYRGNPFQIEVGLAYGGELPGDELAKVMRFANRVPLLYQASACAIHKAVCYVNWRRYGVNQPRGGLPQGPMVLVVHIASVWVPFTSESKEALAHYQEIIEEIKKGLMDCARELGNYLSRRQKHRSQAERRSKFDLYCGELVEALHHLTKRKRTEIRSILDSAADNYAEVSNEF